MVFYFAVVCMRSDLISVNGFLNIFCALVNRDEIITKVARRSLFLVSD